MVVVNICTCISLFVDDFIVDGVKVIKPGLVEVVEGETPLVFRVDVDDWVVDLCLGSLKCVVVDGIVGNVILGQRFSSSA